MTTLNGLLARALPAALLCTAASVMATPNILSVVEKNGYTDRPSAKFTGETFDIQNPNGTILVSGYNVPLFGAGAKTMTDRVHAYANSSATVGLPSYLLGNEYVMVSNNDRDKTTLSLDITVQNPSRVFLLVDNRLGDGDAATPPTLGATASLMKWVDPANGWNPMTGNGNHVGNGAFPDDVGIDESADGSVNNWDSIYFKDVPAGQFTLLEFGEAGRNMYGVVIAPIPEPGTIALLSLGAASLFLARRRR